jgi:hypothetical protein
MVGLDTQQLDGGLKTEHRAGQAGRRLNALRLRATLEAPSQTRQIQKARKTSEMLD